MTIVDKEYGKLTEDQFRRLIRKLPEFRNESRDLQEVLRSASKEKLRELLGDGVWWADVYEQPIMWGVALLVYVLGKAEDFKAIAQSPDPQEALMREMERPEELEWDGGPGGQFTKADIVALVTAMQRNILSIMIYKKSISALIAEARDGNDDALFDAIRVDRSVVSCLTAAARISEAEVLGEKHFFIRLRNALKGPSRKHWEGYQGLKYSLVVLRELGFNQLSDAQLEHLLVDVLKVYPKDYNARKNLRKQYNESRRIKSL